MALTNAQLSADIAALIESYQDWQNLYSDWLGGTATGGPNGDGRYPLKDAQSVVSLVYCPAALASNVVGPSQQAEAWASAAEMHRMASQAAAVLANSHKTFADAAKVASQDARDLTQILRDQTAGMHSNVVYYAALISANATTTSADRIAVSALAANTANAASNAASSATSAAASANAAATFNPALFDLKSDGIASSRLTGIIDIDRIPVLPSQKTYTSSGGIADLTGPQQALIGEGTIITTTDGRRWVYTSGSKTSEASYTILADVTPSWSSITDKPSTFAASPHGHVWADLIDKPDLVINGQASMTARGANGNGYTVIAGGNADYTGSIGFHLGDGTRLGYIGGAHYSNKLIPIAGENGGLFYFNQRPLFAGLTPWDVGNLAPVTTNTIQQINARKVFKDATGGTSATANYSEKVLEVQSATSTDDALMSFHIPGVRAAMFGLATGGDWQVGTPAGVRNLWHSGNFDPSTKAATSHTHAWGDITGKPLIVPYLQAATSAQVRAEDTSGNRRAHVYGDPDGWGMLHPTPGGGWSIRATGSALHFTASGTERTVWHSGNLDPASKANVASPAFSGSVLIRSPGAPASVFALNVGDGTSDIRSQFRGGNTYPLAVSQGGGGSFYLGATNATSPTLLFSNVNGTQVASLTPDGVFATTGSVTANGYLYAAGIRVPTTTYSNSAPSGGVDGDVHIVW